MSKSLQISLLAVAASLVCASPVSAAKVEDPRECPASTPAKCVESAATVAFRRHMTRVMGLRAIWTNQMRCSQGRTVLAWRCEFGALYESGVGTVTYRALPSGWYVLVKVTCRDPATTPRGGCNPRSG